MVDFQTAFNVVLGAFSALVGWLLNTLYQSMRDLTKVDADLTSKVNQIEVLVAGTYVKRVEFDQKIDAMFNKLDAIEEKLDRRLDGINRGQR